MAVLHQLLSKKMDRKEFLLYLGLVILAVTGITALTKSLKAFASEKAEHGYGSGLYGK